MSKHQMMIYSLGAENERVDAGRDGRIRLARPNSQTRTGTGKKTFSPVQLITSRTSVTITG